MTLRQRGFSLIELMVVLGIFLIVTGAVFGLLDVAQQRYRAEQDFLDSFQNARVGIDQLVREIRTAGLPSPYTFPGNALVPPTYPPGWPAWTDPTTADPDLQRRFAIAFRGVPNQNCPIGFCAVPNATNLRLELDMDPENAACPNQVEVVDYRLFGPDVNGNFTLMRRATSKPGSAAFNAATCLPQAGLAIPFAPFVENVRPNPNGVPLFQYACEPGVAPCTPQFIREVIVTLTVRSSRRDIKTQQFRQITLQAAVRRLNPYQ